MGYSCQIQIDHTTLYQSHGIFMSDSDWPYNTLSEPWDIHVRFRLTLQHSTRAMGYSCDIQIYLKAVSQSHGIFMSDSDWPYNTIRAMGYSCDIQIYPTTLYQSHGIFMWHSNLHGIFMWYSDLAHNTLSEPWDIHVRFRLTLQHSTRAMGYSCDIQIFMGYSCDIRI